MDETFDAYNAERLRAAETLLLGRTYLRGVEELLAICCSGPDGPAGGVRDLAAR
jgi:hypothetical protein